MVSAFLSVTLKNLFHCAMFLVLACLALAGIYYNLGATLLAALHLMIYVGAMVVLIIFAIMLTSRIYDRILTLSIKQTLPSFFAVAILISVIISAFKKDIIVNNVDKLPGIDPIFGFSRELLTRYAFPFELVSIILLTALVGSIVMARRD